MAASEGGEKRSLSEQADLRARQVLRTCRQISGLATLGANMAPLNELWVRETFRLIENLANKAGILADEM